MSDTTTDSSSTRKAKPPQESPRQRLRTWQPMGAPISESEAEAPSPFSRNTPSTFFTGGGAFGGGNPSIWQRAGVVQTKLTVNEPDDQYEQEAQRVADTVMRMPMEPPTFPPPPSQATPVTPTLLSIARAQRQSQKPSGDRRSDWRDKGVIELPAHRLARPVTPSISHIPPVQALLIARLQAARAQAIQSRPSVSPALESRIEGMNGGGSPLPDSERNFFESRMGADFSGVRIHTDNNAVQTSRDINARAFTTGNNIAFNSGEYQPGTTAGRHLLAHELTHTVQQGAAAQLKHAVEPQEGAEGSSDTRNEEQKGTHTDEDSHSLTIGSEANKGTSVHAARQSEEVENEVTNSYRVKPPSIIASNIVVKKGDGQIQPSVTKEPAVEQSSSSEILEEQGLKRLSTVAAARNLNTNNSEYSLDPAMPASVVQASPREKYIDFGISKKINQSLDKKKAENQVNNVKPAQKNTVQRETAAKQTNAESTEKSWPESFLDTVMTILEYIWAAIQAILGVIVGILHGIWDFIWGMTIGLVIDVLTAIWHLLGSLLHGISHIFSLLFETPTIADSSWQKVKDFFTGIWFAITNPLETLKAVWGDFIKEIGERESVFGKVEYVVSTSVESILNIVLAIKAVKHTVTKAAKQGSTLLKNTKLSKTAQDDVMQAANEANDYAKNLKGEVVQAANEEKARLTGNKVTNRGKVDGEEASQEPPGVTPDISNGIPNLDKIEYRPKNDDKISHIMQSKAKGNNNDHAWEKIIKLTGDETADFDKVSDLLRKENIADPANLIKKQGYPPENPIVYRFDFIKEVNGEQVYAVFEHFIKNGETYLKDAWVVTSRD